MKERTLSEDLIVTAIGVTKSTNAQQPHAENTVPAYEKQLENRVEHLTHANVELAKDRAFYKIAFQVLLFIDVLYIVWSFIL